MTQQSNPDLGLPCAPLDAGLPWASLGHQGHCLHLQDQHHRGTGGSVPLTGRDEFATWDCILRPQRSRGTLRPCRTAPRTRTTYVITQLWFNARGMAPNPLQCLQSRLRFQVLATNGDGFPGAASARALQPSRRSSESRAAPRSFGPPAWTRATSNLLQLGRPAASGRSSWRFASPDALRPPPDMYPVTIIRPAERTTFRERSMADS